MINPIDRIQAYYDDLTKTDKEIAIYIINHPNCVITEGMDQIAKQTKSSKSAISRFAKRIGYSGYTEFAYDMGRFLLSHDNDDNASEETDPIKRIINTYCEFISRIPETVTKQQIKNVARLFKQAGHVTIMGINRSANSATQFKQRLARVGFSKVSSECDGTTIRDYIVSSTEKDLMIIFSTTDNSKTFTPLFVEKPKCQIIYITCNPNLPFRKHCAEYIVLPRISRDSYASFLDDQAIFMVFVEILIEAIVRESNKTEE